MATSTYSQLTLLELAKRKGPDGSLLSVAEVLAQTNEILRDAIWQEANDTFSHKTVKRLTLPTGSWRKINAGVGVESSQTVPVTETIGMLETYCETDKELVKAASDPKKIRMQEAKAFIEGLGQTLAYTMFYGDARTEPEKFTGIQPRTNSLGYKTVVGNGGSNDLTSIYIVQWGEDKVFMAYPKGSPNYGIQHNDLGEVTVSNATTAAANTSQFQAYRDHFQIKCGLVVRDDRCIARVANIDTGATPTEAGKFDEDYLIEALNEMPSRGAGSVIYAPQKIFTLLDIYAKDKTNVNYTPDNVFGGSIMTFRGLPVRLCEQISIAETAVV